MGTDQRGSDSGRSCVGGPYPPVPGDTPEVQRSGDHRSPEEQERLRGVERLGATFPFLAF